MHGISWVPGSYCAMRTRLSQALKEEPHDRRIVMVCGDDRVSPYAADDVRRLGFVHVNYLRGGRTAWRKAGQPLQTSSAEDAQKLLTLTEDMWYPPYALKQGATEAMQHYLTWEVGLMDQVNKESYVQFGTQNVHQHPIP